VLALEFAGKMLIKRLPICCLQVDDEIANFCNLVRTTFTVSARHYIVALAVVDDSKRYAYCT